MAGLGFRAGSTPGNRTTGFAVCVCGAVAALAAVLGGAGPVCGAQCGCAGGIRPHLPPQGPPRNSPPPSRPVHAPAHTRSQRAGGLNVAQQTTTFSAWPGLLQQRRRCAMEQGGCGGRVAAAVGPEAMPSTAAPPSCRAGRSSTQEQTDACCCVCVVWGCGRWRGVQGVHSSVPRGWPAQGAENTLARLAAAPGGQARPAALAITAAPTTPASTSAHSGQG